MYYIYNKLVYIEKYYYLNYIKKRKQINAILKNDFEVYKYIKREIIAMNIYILEFG